MAHRSRGARDVDRLLELQTDYRRRISRTLRRMQEELNTMARTRAELDELNARADEVDARIATKLRELKAQVIAAQGNEALIEAAFAEIEKDIVEKNTLHAEIVAEPEPTPPGTAARRNNPR